MFGTANSSRKNSLSIQQRIPKNCGCRKMELNCSMFYCIGINCENADVLNITEDNVLEDTDEDIDINIKNILNPDFK